MPARPSSAIRVGTPAELADELAGLAELATGPVLLVGDGAIRHRDLLAQAPRRRRRSSAAPSSPLRQ